MSKQKDVGEGEEEQKSVDAIHKSTSVSSSKNFVVRILSFLFFIDGTSATKPSWWSKYHGPNALIDLHSSPLRGRYLVASCRIEKKTILWIEETALEGSKPEIIQAIAASDALKEEFAFLYPVCGQGKLVDVETMVSKNSWCNEKKSVIKDTVLFRTGSLVNHSCQANANWIWNWDTNRYEFYALKTIMPGGSHAFSTSYI